MSKAAALLLLLIVGAESQSFAAEVRARSEEEMNQRANAKFRVKVTIAEPRQECAAFQTELVRSMMAAGVSRAEVEKEIDRILAEPGEMMNWTRATVREGKSYAQQYRDYFQCTYTTHHLTTIPIGTQSLKTKRTTAPGAPPIGPGEYLRVGPREFLFLPDEHRTAYYDYIGEIIPLDGAPSSGPRPPARVPSTTPASAPQARLSDGPSTDIFSDTFITGLSDSTVLSPWGNQICDTSDRIINTYGIGRSYDRRIKILPNTARTGSTALWIRSKDDAWIVIQSTNVAGGRTCIAARGDAGSKLPTITVGRAPPA